jgi:hypothetical protein
MGFFGDTYGENYEATMGNKTMGKLYGETIVMVKLWEENMGNIWTK